MATGTQQFTPLGKDIVYNDVEITDVETQAAANFTQAQITALQAALGAPQTRVWDAKTKAVYLSRMHHIIVANGDQTTKDDILGDFSQSTQQIDTRIAALIGTISDEGDRKKAVEYLKDIRAYEQQKIGALEKSKGGVDPTNTVASINTTIGLKISALDLSALEPAEAQAELVTLLNFKSAMTTLSPLLTVAHSPEQAQAKAKKKHTPPALKGQQTTSPAAQAAALAIEHFLNESQGYYQEHASSLMDNDTLLNLPEGESYKPDKMFDGTSELGLNNMLDFLSSSHMMDLPYFSDAFGEELTEPVAYSQHMGQSLVQGVRDLYDKKYPSDHEKEFKKLLEDMASKPEFSSKIDTSEPNKAVAMMMYLTDQMNELKANQTIGTDPITHLTPRTYEPNLHNQGLITFHINNLLSDESGPELIGAVDGIVRQMTGGAGLLDIAPHLASVPKIKDELDKLDKLDGLTQDEKIAQGFRRAFESAQTAQERIKRQQRLMESIQFFEMFDRRGVSKQALDNALIAGMKAMGSADTVDPATLDRASLTYAQSFLRGSYEISRDPEVGERAIDLAPQNRSIMLDTLNLARMQQAGLDIGSDSDPVTTDDLDRIYQVYLHTKNSERNGDSFDAPMFFKDNSGQTFIATITLDGLFTIHKLDREKMIRDYAAAGDKNAYLTELRDSNINGEVVDGVPKFATEHQVYRLLYDNHYGFFSGEGLNLLTGPSSDGEDYSSFFDPNNNLHAANFATLEAETSDFEKIDKFSERDKWAKALKGQLEYNRRALGSGGVAIKDWHGKTTIFAENDSEYQKMQIAMARSRSTAFNHSAAKNMLKDAVKSEFKTYIDPNSHSVMVYYRSGAGGRVSKDDITQELATYVNLSSLNKRQLELNPDKMRAMFPVLSQLADAYGMNNALHVGRKLAWDLRLPYAIDSAPQLPKDGWELAIEPDSPNDLKIQSQPILKQDNGRTIAYIQLSGRIYQKDITDALNSFKAAPNGNLPDDLKYMIGSYNNITDPRTYALMNFVYNAQRVNDYNIKCETRTKPFYIASPNTNGQDGTITAYVQKDDITYAVDITETLRNYSAALTSDANPEIPQVLRDIMGAYDDYDDDTIRTYLHNLTRDSAIRDSFGKAPDSTYIDAESDQRCQADPPAANHAATQP